MMPHIWSVSTWSVAATKLLRPTVSCSRLAAEDMKHVLLVFLVGLTIQADPSFEVAAITPCAPATQLNPGIRSSTAQLTESGGRFNGRAVNVAYVLEWAYNIQWFQHSEKPSWITTDCYDIVAKAEGEASTEQMRAMARTLLAERFHLEVHQETKMLPALILSLGKSVPRLTPSKDGEAHAMTMSRRQSADQKTTTYVVAVQHFKLSELGEVISHQLERVILNETGWDGAYDFHLDLVPDDTLPNPMDPSIILRAIREDLGLAINSRIAPVEYLVIDGIDRPSAN